jgi:predicted flap endonuclease-1-like 5' DNA nuclease
MPDTVLIAFLIVAALIALVVFLRMLGAKRDSSSTESSEPTEGHGVSDGMAAAIENVVGEFTGVDAHPGISDPGAANLPPDILTRIKGLGPRAAATLVAIGITRFDQIADWSADDIATVGAKLGNRAERIRRDRWVEQAELLARREIAAFEEKFGKLG